MCCSRPRKSCTKPDLLTSAKVDEGRVSSVPIHGNNHNLGHLCITASSTPLNGIFEFSLVAGPCRANVSEMDVLGLGRACSLGRFCRRTASPSSPPPPPRRPHGHSKGGRIVCCTKAARSAQVMEGTQGETRLVTLRAVDATPESFAPFGQVVAASPDGDQFGPHDAQLELSRGIPRFYIMRLENRPLKFSSITHHASVTQCLGSIGGQDWYLGVAKPSIVDGASEQSGQDGGRKPVQTRAGHCYLPPDPAEVCVFRVSGPKFLKLHKGTWHAGPLFKADAVDFYNLELSNTNVVDHTTHCFKKHDEITFVIED